MSAQTLRIKQIIAILIAILFVAGFFYSPIGAFTGPILGLWFVGTQKPRAGFVWLMSFTFIPLLLGEHSVLWHSTAAQIPFVILWIFVTSLIDILPFLIHRAISPRLKGFFSTLPYPLAAVAIQSITWFILPKSALNFIYFDFTSNLPLLKTAVRFGSGSGFVVILIQIFFTSWAIAGILWIWNANLPISKLTATGNFFLFLFALLFGFRIYIHNHVIRLPEHIPGGMLLVVVASSALILLTLYAIFRPVYRTLSWSSRQSTIDLLESPITHTQLHYQRDGHREFLVSTSAERFPIENGIPQFVTPESISGANKKYNHLYQVIGGFYDDTQRVYCLLRGIDQFQYLRSYLCKLELKPGDRVLETSVGTGLNWKFMPTDTHTLQLHGLDLSAEMLLNCQTNLRRWNLSADLVLGNAEALPYADNSFDCVFHVGGINFFSDRARAINEMIRVARPGTLIMIADETEEHVKTAYENIPYTSRFFKNRKEPVLPPTDLIPAKMQDVTLDTSLMKGHFYVLTFRKPHN